MSIAFEQKEAASQARRPRRWFGKLERANSDFTIDPDPSVQIFDDGLGPGADVKFFVNVLR